MKKYIEFSRGEVMVEEIADKYKKIILNYICLFDYLFISS